ncbi:LuxR C-terminal-related transcriptional regulator [Kitasatospora sp. NPDC096147]|uniref:LuxR C-terminal-related transcriptional regulator n=1 Tax=Kitasatospora sp. NPDC096147 TaxID=3364093 RepID=UPI003819B52D
METTAVPDEAAQTLYRTILAAGGRMPFAALAEDERTLMERLLGAGLVVPDAASASYQVVSPRSAGERLGGELRAAATRMLRQADQLPRVMGGLALAYDAVPRPVLAAEQGAVLEGRSAIRHRVAELVGDSREEVLAAQPGARKPETLALARHQDGPLLARGVRLRTVYQPVVLSSPETVEHSALMAVAGARIRVLDEPYQRMVIIDRRVAVVPTSADNGKAAFIADPAVVAFLVAVFERDWGRAEEPDWGAVSRSPRTGAATRRVGRLLATGLTQKAVATRLGLSERTVAGHISRLREQYGAQTLFQLGWRMRDRSE